MKKRFIGLMILALMFAFIMPAYATNYDYYAQVFKKDGVTRGGEDLSAVTANITFKVLTADSNTAATITQFGDAASTSVTNPVTTTNFAAATVCNGKVQFRTTAATVDLIVVDVNGGFTEIIKGFSPNMHSIVIDETPNVQHVGVIWFGTSNNVVTATGITFKPITVVSDVLVQVVTGDSGMTLNVGSNDTAAGYRSTVSMTSTGFVADTGFITNGSNIDYVPATTYGTLIATAITGSDAAATSGGITMKKHVITTAGTDDDLEYTGSSSSDTAAGYIYYFFTLVR